MIPEFKLILGKIKLRTGYLTRVSCDVIYNLNIPDDPKRNPNKT